ncbi:response regulator [Nitrogeniibacter mangrovi]|uniref:Response regulator n=1 Tax=Nitrogeniibacter mangrovi TaxID=2016596 RepID=A0A6C1B456_9RHOO|nr:response regulator [Nitrogeniibacter mangrovi]QID18461.1 response regulator [Nitrogeniibacter mangrovi]
MRLLIVEDDPLLGDGLCAGLREAGFVVDWVRDGPAAEAALAGGGFAAVVLDLGLPRLDGREVLARRRAAADVTPVLVLTARDQVRDKVEALNLGADDYLVKPFDLDELTARLRALLRRAGGQARDILQAGEVALDPAARSVTRGGVPVTLTGREFDVLELLMRQRGRVVTRRQIEDQLYSWGDEVESNVLEVHIHHLRKKLGSGFIRTVRGVGYTLGEGDT